MEWVLIIPSRIKPQSWIRGQESICNFGNPKWQLNMYVNKMESSICPQKNMPTLQAGNSI